MPPRIWAFNPKYAPGTFHLTPVRSRASHPYHVVVTGIRGFICLILLGCAFLAVPADAAPSQGCGDNPVPDGDSHLEQYLPTVPGSCGDQEIDPGGGSGGSGSGGADDSSGGPVPGSTIEELQDLGPAGAATAELAEGGSPTDGAPSTSTEQKSGNGGSPGTGLAGTPGEHLAAADDESLLASIFGQLGAEGGAPFIAILALITVAGVAFILRRRRFGR